jgi:hypothetical protein
MPTDGQSASESWCQVSVGRPLWREDGYLLYNLLALASAVFLGSESLGTCDRILLSQIWDFPFCRLLRLAGSRWRYSTPPPQGLYVIYVRSADTMLSFGRLHNFRSLITCYTLFHGRTSCSISDYSPEVSSRTTIFVTMICTYACKWDGA